MKKFLSLLAAFTVLLASCSNISEIKTEKVNEEGNVTISLGGTERTIKPLEEGWSVNEVSSWKFKFTSETNVSVVKEFTKGPVVYEDDVPQDWNFKLPADKYILTVTGSSEIYKEKPFVVEGKTEIDVSTGNDTKTVYVQLKKSEEGTGSFMYQLILKDADFTGILRAGGLDTSDNPEGTISGTGTVAVGRTGYSFGAYLKSVTDTEAELINLSVGISVDDYSPGNVKIEFTGENVPSGYYRLCPYYTYSSASNPVQKFFITIEDTLVEIADDQETDGSYESAVKGYSAKKIYVSESEGGYNGLTKAFPATRYQAFEWLSKYPELWCEAQIESLESYTLDIDSVPDTAGKSIEIIARDGSYKITDGKIALTTTNGGIYKLEATGEEHEETPLEVEIDAKKIATITSLSLYNVVPELSNVMLKVQSELKINLENFDFDNYTEENRPFMTIEYGEGSEKFDVDFDNNDYWGVKDVTLDGKTSYYAVKAETGTSGVADGTPEITLEASIDGMSIDDGQTIELAENLILCVSVDFESKPDFEYEIAYKLNGTTMTDESGGLVYLHLANPSVPLPVKLDENILEVTVTGVNGAGQEFPATAAFHFTLAEPVEPVDLVTDYYMWNYENGLEPAYYGMLSEGNVLTDQINMSNRIASDSVRDSAFDAYGNVYLLAMDGADYIIRRFIKEKSYSEGMIIKTYTTGVSNIKIYGDTENNILYVGYWDTNNSVYKVNSISSPNTVEGTSEVTSYDYGDETLLLSSSLKKLEFCWDFAVYGNKAYIADDKTVYVYTAGTTTNEQIDITIADSLFTPTITDLIVINGYLNVLVNLYSYEQNSVYESTGFVYQYSLSDLTADPIVIGEAFEGQSLAGYNNGSAYITYIGPDSRDSQTGFFGPGKIVAIKPDAITVADYGIYIEGSTDETEKGKFYRVSRIVEVNLSSSSITSANTIQNVLQAYSSSLPYDNTTNYFEYVD